MVKNFLVPLYLHKIIHARSYAMIILSSPSKKIPIYIEPSTGKILQTHLLEGEKIRPMTHDLIQMILQSLDAKVSRVVLSDFQENIYFSKLFILQKSKNDLGESLEVLVEADSRPSDAIALALLSQAPLFCTEEVHEKTISIEE